MKPTQKLTLPAGIPQPPAPPKGCRWEYVGKGCKGGIPKLKGYAVAVFDLDLPQDGWVISCPNCYGGFVAGLLFCRAVPIASIGVTKPKRRVEK